MPLTKIDPNSNSHQVDLKILNQFIGSIQKSERLSEKYKQPAVATINCLKFVKVNIEYLVDAAVDIKQCDAGSTDYYKFVTDFNQTAINLTGEAGKDVREKLLNIVKQFEQTFQQSSESQSIEFVYLLYAKTNNDLQKRTHKIFDFYNKIIQGQAFILEKQMFSFLQSNNYASPPNINKIAYQYFDKDLGKACIYDNDEWIFDHKLIDIYLNNHFERKGSKAVLKKSDDKKSSSRKSISFENDKRKSYDAKQLHASTTLRRELHFNEGNNVLLSLDITQLDQEIQQFYGVTNETTKVNRFIKIIIDGDIDIAKSIFHKVNPQVLENLTINQDTYDASKSVIRKLLADPDIDFDLLSWLQKKGLYYDQTDFIAYGINNNRKDIILAAFSKMIGKAYTEEEIAELTKNNVWQLMTIIAPYIERNNLNRSHFEHILHMAIRANQITTVRALFDASVEYNDKLTGVNANDLHESVEQGHNEMVGLLITNGANLQVVQGGKTAIQLSLEKQSYTVARTFLANPVKTLLTCDVHSIINYLLNNNQIELAFIEMINESSQHKHKCRIVVALFEALLNRVQSEIEVHEIIAQLYQIHNKNNSIIVKENHKYGRLFFSPFWQHTHPQREKVSETFIGIIKLAKNRLLQIAAQDVTISDKGKNFLAQHRNRWSFFSTQTTSTKILTCIEQKKQNQAKALLENEQRKITNILRLN